MRRKLYLLKIELADIDPAIWRRFVVPADIPLDRLHDVIQIVMGWSDYHLHEFNIDGRRYTEFFDEIEEDVEVPAAEDGLFTLKPLVKRKEQEFTYLYDFGDGWLHKLVVDDANYIGKPQDEPIIVCLEGAGTCPPEDVGGVPGYYDFCEALADPGHERHEEYKTWYGKPFKREEFNLNEVNMALLKYIRWSRERLLVWLPEEV